MGVLLSADNLVKDFASIRAVDGLSLDIPEGVWGNTLEDRIPPKLLELNQKAFAAGAEYASG